MANDDILNAWGGHQWLQRRPRHFELESGESVFQRRCTQCGRDFVIDMPSGARHAVHVSIFSFHQLHDDVTQRWLGEPCPGERVLSDDGDRKKKVAELRVAKERRREAHTPPIRSMKP
jgi:hypothetical protein